MVINLTAEQKVVNLTINSVMSMVICSISVKYESLVRFVFSVLILVRTNIYHHKETDTHVSYFIEESKKVSLV